MSAIAAIYLLKMIIDHLNSNEPSASYGIGLFIAFTIFRLTAIVSRGYYDLHSYNFFRFV